MFKLKSYLAEFKKELILGPFFKLWEAVFELIIPLVMARIIDVGVKNGDRKTVLALGGVILGLAAVGFCSTLLCQYMASKASQGLGTRLRGDLFRKINRLPARTLDAEGQATLITRLTNDVDRVQAGVAMLIRLAVRTPFLVIGAAVMALTIDAKLSLIFFAAIPILALIIWLILWRAAPLYGRVQERLDAVSGLTRENLSGARVVRAFAAQDRETERFEGAVDRYAQAAYRVGKISALMNPLTFGLMNLAIVAILWFGGYRVYDGALTQGQIIAFINYMMQILAALLALANIIQIFMRASASAGRIRQTLELDAEDPDRPAERQPVFVPGADAIRFERVSFAYARTGENALGDLSFSVPCGQTVGVIGATGSGKTTVAELILRFYDASKGRVLVGGVDVRALSQAQLRAAIGAAPQRSVLFAGTVRSNLLWGDASASDAQLLRALKTAQALAFVTEAGGLDAPVAQGGKNFSGGQRQRLAIARALVRQPQILILDDSFSALDYATDAALRAALKADFAQKTILMISQRVSSIRQADRILVLDDGRAVGFDTHENLLKTCETYAQICASQLEGAAL